VSIQGPDGPGSSGPPGGPGGPPPSTRPGATSQPLRAALVVVVAVAIAVGVLVRMSPAHSAASPTGTTHPAAASTTTVPSATTTPAVVTTTTTTTTVPPATVTVLVLNGWTTEHAALYFQKKLAGDGYDTLAPNNALDETSTTTSVFVVAPSDSTTGTAIAELLGLPSSAVVVPSATNDSAIPASLLHQADIIVVVGADISKQVPVGYTGVSA
jgi:hypothetical protein